MRRFGNALARAGVAGSLLISAMTVSPPVSAADRGAAATVLPSATWSTPQRAIPGNFDQFSAQVDSHGHVHIAVTGGGNLYYATDRSGSWTHHLVLAKTSNYDYGQPSLALDEHNRVHIAVERFPNAEGDKGIWYVSDVGRSRGVFPSTPTMIAPTGNGEPVLAVSGGHLFLVDVNGWCCVGDGTVQLRTDVSGSWTVSTVGPGSDPSFRLGSDGHAQVAFDRTDTQPGVYYARASKATGNFTTARIPGTTADDFPVAVIPSTSGHDSLPVLALDGRNDPWIAFDHFAGGTLSVLLEHHTSSGWATPITAVPHIGPETITSFDLDDLQRPNVAYGNTAIRVTMLRQGAWHPRTVASDASARWLLLRRAVDGGAVVAWTAGSGVFVTRR